MQLITMQSFSPSAPLHGVDAEEMISGEYIVVFKNEAGDDEGNLICSLLG